MTRSDEPSMSERLDEVSRLMRSPLAQSFGQMCEAGREGCAKLDHLFRDLPSIEAKTPADALALVSIAGDVFGQLIQNAEGNGLAHEATGSLACILLRLRACLADLAGMEVDAFGLSPELGLQRAH